MIEEKRRSPRSKCFLPAELLEQERGRSLIKRASVHDFSQEGLKLMVNFSLKPGFVLKSRIYVPEKKISTPFSGEIRWFKFVDSKLEAGLKIKEMDDEAKENILDWVFPKWMERERGRKGK